MMKEHLAIIYKSVNFCVVELFLEADIQSCASNSLMLNTYCQDTI